VKTYSLSKAAESDLEAILDYTVDTWGAKQANTYLEGFVECFTRFASAPGPGHAGDDLKSGLKSKGLNTESTSCSSVRPGLAFG
jgi:toxin ParE1/3/4